jgi:hypothetical protein
LSARQLTGPQWRRNIAVIHTLAGYGDSAIQQLEQLVSEESPMMPEDEATVLLELAWAWNRGSEYDPARAKYAIAQMMEAGKAADASSSKYVKPLIEAGMGRMLLQAGINGDIDPSAVWTAAAGTAA